MPKKEKAPYNRTLEIVKGEEKRLKASLVKLNSPVTKEFAADKIINQDLFEVIDLLPGLFVDLLFVDPPYNMYKKFNTNSFNIVDSDKYQEWMESWLSRLVRILKPDASIYICGDWRASAAIFNAGSKYFSLRNRITWEREKGRGAKTNWKNCSEDIWYFTKGQEFKFNIDDVKVKRKVLAPYRQNGKPKDWVEDNEANFRITHPSNIWTDITVPFWSMPENTEHPTQKPEKLLAKIILAGTNEGDMVFDPFLGSGTTAVAAKKLGRNYCGVEIDEQYCMLAQKRLELAEKDKSIQGFSGGMFWERNTLSEQKKKKK